VSSPGFCAHSPNAALKGRQIQRRSLPLDLSPFQG
jgi:hypothetical protein